MKRHHLFEILPLILLTGVGLILRLYTAYQAPGFFYDEAIYAIDSLRTLREPGIPIFFDTLGHMREPMYMYIQAIALWFQERPTAFGFRATSSLIGAATIPVVYLLAREFRGHSFALLAAAIFTFMRWHIHFSGLGFRTILSPLFAALVLLFLLRFLRTQSWKDALLTGLFLGLGLYTYLAFRLVPFAVGLSLLLPMLTMRNSIGTLRSYTAKCAALVGTAILVFLPLGIDFIKNPEHFSGRAEETNYLNQEGAAKRLTKQIVDVALSPLLRGDHVEKHNIPGPPRFIQIPDVDPVYTVVAWGEEMERARAENRNSYDQHGTGVPTFPIPLGIFFYVGFVLLVIRWRDARSMAILVFLLIGSLASILSFGAPNLLRLLMLSPIAAILIAVGLQDSLLKLDNVLKERSPRLCVPVVCTLIATLTIWSLFVDARRWYQWPTHPLVPQGFNAELADIGHYLGEQPDRLPVRMPFGVHPTLTYLADCYRFNPPAEELGERWWELRTVPPFPRLETLGRPVPGGRSIEIEHPAGLPFGILIEIQSN